MELVIGQRRGQGSRGYTSGIGIIFVSGMYREIQQSCSCTRYIPLIPPHPPHPHGTPLHHIVNQKPSHTLPTPPNPSILNSQIRSPNPPEPPASPFHPSFPLAPPNTLFRDTATSVAAPPISSRTQPIHQRRKTDRRKKRKARPKGEEKAKKKTVAGGGKNKQRRRRARKR